MAGRIPALLLALLTRKHSDDYFRHRLALAALSLPELPSDFRQEQARVINGITKTAFSLWWEYHQNGTSAAVPHLTRMLPALAQINGSMEGTPLLAWCCQQLRDAAGRTRGSGEGARRWGGPAQHPDVCPRSWRLCTMQTKEVRWEGWEGLGSGER